MPTIVYFLAKMRMVTARFLWRNIKYAILIIFILAAVLTSSTDWWNQTVFAAPMIALYLLSIVIAWLVGPKPEKDSEGPPDAKLRLVFAAAVIDRAWKHRQRAPGEFPRRA
jgi:sec-independent protein translocase protein TatC